jgi:hypothetical protein
MSCTFVFWGRHSDIWRSMYVGLYALNSVAIRKGIATHRGVDSAGRSHAHVHCTKPPSCVPARHYSTAFRRPLFRWESSRPEAPPWPTSHCEDVSKGCSSFTHNRNVSCAATAIQAQRGEVVLPLLILYLGTRWGWMVSVTPLPCFTPWRKDPRNPLNRRLGGPQSWSGSRD